MSEAEAIEGLTPEEEQIDDITYFKEKVIDLRSEYK